MRATPTTRAMARARRARAPTRGAGRRTIATPRRRRATNDDGDATTTTTTTTTTTAASYEEDEAEPPRRRGTTTTFPLACPVSLKALRGDGVEPTSGLRYEEREGRWDLTVGAAENARAGARVGSLVDLAREALPNELKGLLPTMPKILVTTYRGN